MKNSQLLKLDMEAGIDGILVNEKKDHHRYLKISPIQLFCFFSFRSFYHLISKSHSTKFNKKKIIQSFYHY